MKNSCVTVQVKYLEIEINDDDFKGMPFVMVSAGNWIKNSGSDFYVNFAVASRQSSQAQKVILFFLFLIYALM